MIPLHKDNQEEGVCPICQESLKEAMRTNCGHLFCRVCLTQHVEKASASGVFCCPLCRKPCSEEVLGTGYICPNHQKRVCRFCEESRLLLCVECLVSPEHVSHHELTIENALSHYKERLNRRSRKLRKDIAELQRLKIQEEKKLQALQQWLGQLEHMPAEVARILDISRAVTQLSSLVIDLERTAKELDTNTLKNAGDLLNRSAPQKLEIIYPQLEKRVSELLLQPSSEALTCSSLGHLTSGSPQPPLSPSSNLSRPPLDLPSASSGLPAPEHVPISSCPPSSPDA
ncbi:tripartite motif-containing protein 40 isoform X2 [Piliocolobus tephrosceles]|uniref:tripartite motif-containing protein 40 isoform X2 n=1 Tax=Piliocolobus tephrosceles TaxID=591936 RepID=UPI000E6AEA02|nr:tripartite motif-containing protein 40 isoform X2 [Piliocolobus tephrosceles]